MWDMLLYILDQLFKPSKVISLQDGVHVFSDILYAKTLPFSAKEKTKSFSEKVLTDFILFITNL